jgi:hypothetical protein
LAILREPGIGTMKSPWCSTHASAAQLALLDMAPDTLNGFRNYIGSVAANRAAGTIAVSSPQGNCFAVIDAVTGKMLTARALTEVCGLAPDGQGFIATTGAGKTVGPEGAIRSEPDCVWDNHLLRIGQAG